MDAPSYLLPGRKLPLALIIKDAHRFPVYIRSIRVRDAEGRESFRVNIDQIIDKPLYYALFELDIAQYDRGSMLELDTFIELKIGNRKETVKNHNLETLEKLPLRVRLFQEELPGFDGVHYVDMHCHSEYTWDEIEYGAPVAVLAEFARAMGISIQPVTDHSYDLDKEMHGIRHLGEGTPRWDALGRDVSEHSSEDLLLVRGEEVSCGNDRKQNVHMLVYGHHKFIRGRGDRGDFLLRNRPDHSYREILDNREAGIPMLAAHPYEKTPYAEGLLLNRGTWDEFELDERLTGLQILNGRRDEAFEKGRAVWIRGLLKGRRIHIYAGNDAHGNFNRYQQIRIPLWSLKQDDEKRYARYRTAFWLNEFSENGFLQAVRDGNCCITDGPLLFFGQEIDDKISFINGCRINMSSSGKLVLLFRTSRDFYSQSDSDRSSSDVMIYSGRKDNTREEIFRKICLSDIETERRIEIDKSGLDEIIYLRAEFVGENEFCMTNAVFLK